MALIERRRSGVPYREMINHIIRQEMTKSLDQQNYIIMNGMGLLMRNLHMTNDEFRYAFLLRPINDNNVMYPVGADRQNNRMGLIEHLENEISHRPLNNDRGIDHDEQDQVIVIHSDSESETDSEAASAYCPRSVRERVIRLLEPKLKNRIRREMEPQLRDRIRRELVPQLTDQIRREMEPRLREQIRRELEPMRENIENEIQEADEHIAWIDFLLYIVKDFEIDATLDIAIAICEICTSACMKRRPITLNCGHIFCGNCLRD